MTEPMSESTTATRGVPGAMSPGNRAFHALLVLAIPIALVTLSTRIVATNAAMRLEYSAAAILPPSGMSPEERDAAADATRRYVIGIGPRTDIEALQWDERALYSPSEIEHLDDVRTVFRRLWAIGLAAWIFVLAASRIRSFRRRIDGARAIARGGAITATAIILLAVGIILSFDTVFTLFHQLFFPPGTWTFSIDSGLISLFPERFWRDAAIAIATLLLLEGLWFWGIYRRAVDR